MRYNIGFDPDREIIEIDNIQIIGSLELDTQASEKIAELLKTGNVTLMPVCTRTWEQGKDGVGVVTDLHINGFILFYKKGE